MPEETAPFRALDVAHVHIALERSAFGDIRYCDVTGSTNDDAIPFLGHADAAGTTFVADEQTSGHGRKPGRRWIAPRGSALLFTTILPTSVRADALWAVPFWVALAVADGIGEACGVHVGLRWPNDGFVGEHKALGILCVSRVAGNVAAVGCGVGINVLRPPAETTAAVDPPPAFLSDVAPRVSREYVLSEVLLAFGRRLPALTAPEIVARTYEERAQLIGAHYRVVLDREDETLDGVVRGLGPDGALRLEVAGTERLVALADAHRL